MKNMDKLLIGIIIFLFLSNLFFGYMFFFNNKKPNGPGGFDGGFPQMELSDSEIQSVTSFFESTSDINEIQNYCEDNRMGCFYYCREINPNSEYCSDLMERRPDSSNVQKLN